MAFEHLEAVIADGITKKLHTCVQVCVSIRGERQIDAGFGLATSTTNASADTVMLWRSAGKPLTAVGIVRLAEQGELSLEDPVGRHLAGARNTVYEQLTLTQLMSHSTGLPAQETRWPDADWDDIVAGILATSDHIQQDFVAYQPQATWFLLGEILRLRSQSETFSTALNDLVLAPLNMNRCSCGISEQQAATDRNLLPDLLIRQGEELRSSPLTSGAALHVASPGGNMRGPVSDLVEFYEMLLRQGVLTDGAVFLRESSVALMTEPHRRNLFDRTFQHAIDFGLGFIVSSQHHGPMVPYGYGRFSSTGSAGHGGAQCSMGFCDPTHGLAVAWAANGFCSEPQHQRRNKAINEAIYRDLDLVG